jgi:hypothetical protein
MRGKVPITIRLVPREDARGNIWQIYSFRLVTLVVGLALKDFLVLEDDVLRYAIIMLHVIFNPFDCVFFYDLFT